MSEQNAALFTSMADTFEALGRDEQALKAFIAKSPSTLDVGTDSFRVQQPFLDDLTAFSKDFSGATHELRGALPPVNRAVEIGTPVLVRVGQAQRRGPQDARHASRTSPRRPAPTPRCAA